MYKQSVDSEDSKLVMERLERLLDQMIADRMIEEDRRNTAKLLLVAMHFGCKNIDKLAEITKLSRDRFVRPRARRLREARIWNTDGTVGMEYPDGPSDYTYWEFVLQVMCADGLVMRKFDTPAPVAKGTWDALFAWRAQTLPSPLTAEILVESLSCEALARATIPAEHDGTVTAFRHQNRSARLNLARSWVSARLTR